MALVYDVHHHRCRPDALSIKAATALAMTTWGSRAPWMHISSPRDGWSGTNPRAHADYVDPADFPSEWTNCDVTIDVEAKAKERAVVAIKAPSAYHKAHEAKFGTDDPLPDLFPSTNRRTTGSSSAAAIIDAASASRATVSFEQVFPLT